jgi:uncharacterized protein (DUF2267 family)
MQTMRHRLQTKEGKALYASLEASVHGIWHHKTGAGFLTIPTPWVGLRPKRMESGLYWMEFEANAYPDGIKNG